MIPRFHPIFASSPSKITSVIGVLHAPQLISGIFRTPRSSPKEPKGLFLKIQVPPMAFPRAAPSGPAGGGTDNTIVTSEAFFVDLAGRENEKTTKVPGTEGWGQGMLVGEKIGWITPSKNVILIVFRDLEGKMMITKWNLEHHLVDTKPNDRNVGFPLNNSHEQVWVYQEIRLMVCWRNC